MNTSMFESIEVLPGIFHIKDCLGVCMTLLTGSERVLLVDTGYGIRDVIPYIASITPLPLTVILTHGHHDHALGARCFEKTFMLESDLPVFRKYTGRFQRERVLTSAEGRGIKPDTDDYLTRVISDPLPLKEGDISLGGLTARVISCPGHTPGSAMIYVPEYRLLLTGDNWNPCTWLFFESAVPVRTYRKNLSTELSKLDVKHVLCPHLHSLADRSMLAAFLSRLTVENLEKAQPVDIHPYEAINTRELKMEDGQLLVFDYDKFAGGNRCAKGSD